MAFTEDEMAFTRRTTLQVFFADSGAPVPGQMLLCIVATPIIVGITGDFEGHLHDVIAEGIAAENAR